MIKKLNKHFFLFTFFLQASILVFAADTSLVKHKIAVFAPLYLDQTFDAEGNYVYEGSAFPSQSIAGLDFYQGVKLALDSLEKEGKQLEVFIFDTEKPNTSVANQLNAELFDDLALIIVHCSVSSLREFADEGLRRNIPVINVNLPNNGGIRNNPFFVMLNSTLQTQCESIYQYMQKYYATKKIVVFRRNGQIENMIKNIFDTYAEKTASVPLELVYVNLNDDFTAEKLKASLDTLAGTLCVVGSLNDAFGKKIASHLADLSVNYPISVMGMPTWDGNKTFANKEYHNMEVIYCTPFFNPRTDKVSESITKYYDSTMYSRPSDMAMRGYEAIWRFGNLLVKYEKDFPSNLNSQEFNLFREYDIRPEWNTTTREIDYFENKKLYFLKWKAGTLIGAN